MKKLYVKKPIPVEAVQFNGDNFRELYDFAGNNVYFQDGYVYVHTLEGDMRMKNAAGDYLIRGVKGEFYPCEKTVFEESYEEAPARESEAPRGSSDKVIYLNRIPAQEDKQNGQYSALDIQSDKPSSGEYATMTMGQYRKLAKDMRVDESRDAEWQCPTCKKRVKNLQQQTTRDGKPCWGCRACCDTVDASYFGGKACKLYEQGSSGYMWF